MAFVGNVYCGTLLHVAFVPFHMQFSRFAAHAEAAAGCTWVLHASSMAAAALAYADEFASEEKAEEQAGEHDWHGSAAAAAAAKKRDMFLGLIHSSTKFL